MRRNRVINWKAGLAIGLLFLVGYVFAQNHSLAFINGAGIKADDVEAALLALETAIANEKALAETETDAYALTASAQAVDEALAAYNQAAGFITNGAPVDDVEFVQEEEPNGALDGSNAQAIPLGSDGCAIIDGAISSAGDIDLYQFTITSTSKLWAFADTGGTQNPGSASRNISMRVFTSGGSLVETDLDDGTGNGLDGTTETGQAAAIGGLTLNPGTYIIELNDFLFNQAIDPYRLFVVVTPTTTTAESEGNGTAATANSLLTMGGPTSAIRSGQVENSGLGSGVDYFSVYAEAGEVLYINAEANPERDSLLGFSAGTDLIVQLRNSSDSLILSADSSGAVQFISPITSGHPAESFAYLVPTTGTYYIRLSRPGFALLTTNRTYQLMAARCAYADLEVEKTGPAGPVNAGANITYTITLTNNGPSEAKNTVLTDMVPANTTLANFSQTSGPAFTIAAGVTASIASFAPGATATFSLTVTVNCSTPNGTTITNTATVSSDTEDQDGDNNSDSVMTTVSNATPTITCLANVTAVAPATCPPASGTVVTFTTPAGSDNSGCPVTVVCSPSTGSTFPVGTTTVTCTATDAANQTAQCSFTVAVFNGCLQDEANPGNVVLFNTFTGEYRYCCNGIVIKAGKGSVLSQGCNYTISHNPADRRVTIKVSFTTKQGSASLQSPPGATKCNITDKNISNNTNCTSCGAPVVL